MSAGARPAVNIWRTGLYLKPKQIWGKIHRKHLVWQTAATITRWAVFRGVLNTVLQVGERRREEASFWKTKTSMSTPFCKEKVESFFSLKIGSSKSNKIHLLTHTLWNVESQGQREGLAIQTCAHFNTGQWTDGLLEAQHFTVDSFCPPCLPPSFFFFLIIISFSFFLYTFED